MTDRYDDDDDDDGDERERARMRARVRERERESYTELGFKCRLLKFSALFNPR